MDLRRLLALPSVLALIGANLVPLVGAVFFGWSLAEILLLFWLESAVIGLFTVVKLVMTGGGKAFFQVPFFLMHFGIFMFVHLLFLLILFVGPELLGRGVAGLLPFFRNVALGAVTLLASHAISFWINFVNGPERRGDPDKIFVAPYPRVVAMHLTIILGSFLVAAFDDPRGALAILVGVKIVVDVASHSWERSRLAPPAASTPPAEDEERALAALLDER